MISGMKPPVSSPRVVLIEDRRSAPAFGAVRRYRLARLRFDGPGLEAAARRFEYLKRTHD
jgi:hypothetical protein